MFLTYYSKTIEKSLVINTRTIKNNTKNERAFS